MSQLPGMPVPGLPVRETVTVSGSSYRYSIPVTGAAEKMVQGDLNSDLSRNYVRNSGDEIDRQYQALDRMRANVKTVMDKNKHESLSGFSRSTIQAQENIAERSTTSDRAGLCRNCGTIKAPTAGAGGPAEMRRMP